MAASLNVQFIDPPDPTLPNPAPIAAVLSKAFAAWTQHFDYTTGTYTVNVSFRAFTQPRDLSLSLSETTFAYTPVAQSQFLTRVETSFGLAVADRAYDPATSTALTFYVNPAYLAGSIPVTSLLGPAEREFGTALGITSFYDPLAFIDYSRFTVFEAYSFNVPGGSPLQEAHYGPNAQATYGGPVPLFTPSQTYVPGFVAVNSAIQPALSLQPLDVALLRDAGLPALSDQEVGEHEIARLYVAAFGRNADSAGLIGNYDALLSGEPLAQVGDGLVGSAEFADSYGNPSNTSFATNLYENALGRAPTGAESQFVQNALAAGASRGALVAAFADSDEARGHLNGNPNITYAGAAEAQIARLYDAAFGRDADPAGFVSFTHALITGETLGQVAATFIASPEFAKRYGAAPSDQALVDGLYTTALHRAPNAAEEGFYARLLGAGQISRSDLLVGFSESPEHVNLVARQASARGAAGYNADVGAHLGIIPMISAPTLA